MADYDGDGIPDLVFIKTKNTGVVIDPHNADLPVVEVHIASGASNYQTRILETGTTFLLEDDGVWRMADYDGDGIPDLIFIKTSHTDTHTVEVHIAAGAGSRSTGWIVLRNESQGKYTSFLIQAPPNVALVGNSAEWIVERLKAPFSPYPYEPLPSYGAVTFHNAFAATASGAVLVNAGNTLDMTNENNETISKGQFDGPGVVTCIYTGP
jgi:hypothetical protein